jgi:Golgi SNAP receptor complex protein 2
VEAILIQLESTTQTRVFPSDAYDRLSQIDLRITDFESQVENEGSKPRRDDLRRRVQQLRSLHVSTKQSLNGLVRRRFPAYLASQQREELFAGADLESGARTQTELNISDSLDRSSALVGGYLEAGREALRELGGQRERLKGAQRRALDILHSLGLSNALLRAVEGRDASDRRLVFGGAALVLIFLAAVLWWRHRR